jgi:hypothetical protein
MDDDDDDDDGPQLDQNRVLKQLVLCVTDGIHIVV